MKLVITQILLGALVVASSIFTAAWYFPALIPPVPTETASEYTGEYVPAMTTYYEEHWLIIFGWIAVLILLGLAVLGCGIAQLQKQKARSNDFRLAIAQTVLGVFIVAASFVTAAWYEPILLPTHILWPGGGLFWMWSTEYLLAFHGWNAALFLIGLAVFSFGIAQLTNAGRLKGASPLSEYSSLSPSQGERDTG
jgi:hypothetical protein